MWAAGSSNAYEICKFNPDGNPVRTVLLHIWAGSKRPQVGPPMWSAVCAGVRLRLAKCLRGSLSLVVETRSVLYKHVTGLWRYDS